MNDDKLLPNPPDTLTGAALELWRGYAGDLQRRGLLEDSDLPALARLCLLEAEANELTLTIAAEGAVTGDRDGTQRRHPAVMALTNLSTVIEQLKRGLKIGGRYRLEKEPAKEKPLSRLMQIRKGIKPPGPGPATN